MFRLILFNTWTFVNVTSTRTGHNSAGLSEPVLQYTLYRFWQFSWNDNMCKWKTWKVSSNTMGGHVVVAVWFPSKSPLHVLLLPVPVSLRSNKDVMVIRGRCWQEVLFTAVDFLTFPQIVPTWYGTFPLRISWENLIKDQSIFSLWWSFC